MGEASNGHIGEAELAKLLEESRRRAEPVPEAADVHPHFAVCAVCREQFQGLSLLDRQLKNMKPNESTKRQANCPEAEVWHEIAGGLTPPERTLACIEHASRCDYCGPQLRRAVGELTDLHGEVTDEERQRIATLESAREEWQQNLAQRIAGSRHSGTEPEPVPWWRRWLAVPGSTGRLAMAGVCLLAVVAVGSWVVVQRHQPAAANRLLARAYTEKRTLELRFADAGYAPLRVQRGPASSFIARPAALLKAEALIAGQLAAHPDDPAWLQASGRADVLEGRYDAAVESLQRALELQPHSPQLLADLGTAYFQRAQSEDRPEDYGAAFEYLSQVLARQPDNTIALFNRAIVAEHQFLYQQALEDWEHYLKLDSRSEWADEARNRAESVRAKLKEHERGAAPLLSPEQVASATNFDANADVERRVEQYLEVAVQSWLPQAYPERGVSANASARRALFFLAELTTQKHNDRWLSDLLKGSSSPSFPRAVAALAHASQMNHSANYRAVREQAGIAGRLFHSSGNQAGLLRAQFEQAYSEQLARNTDECRRDATVALAQAELLSYSWLEIQLGLEKAVCFLLAKDDWGTDERMSRRAMDRARESNYDGLYLRALYFVADDQVQNGDLSAGLKSVALGLQRYWLGQIPAVRGYNFYDMMGSLPELAAKRPYLVMAVWREATVLAESDGNLLTRAWTHSFAARAATAVHATEFAERHYTEALRLFALAPRTEFTRDAILWNEIHAAGAEARLGQFELGIARLTRIQNQIPTQSNKHIEETFYATLGELELRSHHPAQAKQAFRPALESAERRLSSLNSERERIDWSKEAAPIYLGMAEAELVQGNVEQSLDYFEWYLGASSRSAKNGLSRVPVSGAVVPDSTWLASRLPRLSRVTVLGYAALPDGIAIWTYDNRGVNAQWIPQSDQDLQELAARFYALASVPRSEVTALRRDSQSLYRSLIAPVEARLDPGRTLVIEADGWLAQVPFEALLDSSGHYLIERAPVVHSLGQTMDASLHEETPISRDLRALIVASTASSQREGLIPLPDVAAEAETVASTFESREMLKGSGATLAAVERNLPDAAVFHFTGHSLGRPNGAALMLAAASSQESAPALLNGDRLRSLDLRHLQLAFLSTCNTESGSDGARGFNTIAEALQRAGVPHVVASRWAVDSVETRKFVEDFYRNALSGHPVSEAVRQTSLSMMVNPRTSHPYYWSAFSAYGRP
ncbi:MAG: CHAT domain-containing protein [Acidobacteriia bacterium]|nr:CHAT domain-containing protein [Terriglobia bacterium]